jgi:AraC-like DNA-binding protein
MLHGGPMKTAGDPRFHPWRVRHFEASEVNSLNAPPDVEDYLENAFLYRRTPPVSFNGEPVDTTMRWFAGSSAAFLHAVSRNPGVTGRRKEDDDADSMDGLLVCFVTYGRMEVETDDKLLCLSEGDTFVLDTSVPHVMRNYPGHVVAIFVPRMVVASALDADQTAKIAGRIFTENDLSDLFGLQVRYMVDALGKIPASAFDVALKTAADVALAMIHNGTFSSAAEKLNLIARVKTLVAAAGTDPELTTAKIAAMLNVSRSVLYEAFSGQQLTVAAYLRDHRLRTFLQLLRGAPDKTIQELARRAGFGGNASDFTKLFRRAYGVSPSSMRATLIGAVAQSQP